MKDDSPEGTSQDRTVQYSTVLICTVLYCTVLYCTFIGLYCAVLYYYDYSTLQHTEGFDSTVAEGIHEYDVLAALQRAPLLVLVPEPEE